MRSYLSTARKQGHPLLHALERVLAGKPLAFSSQVKELAARVQEITGESVELALVDQGYTGESAADATAPRSVEVAGGQARLRALAAALGCGMQLRVGGTISPPGA